MPFAYLQLACWIEDLQDLPNITTFLPLDTVLSFASYSVFKSTVKCSHNVVWLVIESSMWYLCFCQVLMARRTRRMKRHQWRQEQQQQLDPKVKHQQPRPDSEASAAAVGSSFPSKGSSGEESDHWCPICTSLAQYLTTPCPGNPITASGIMPVALS